MVEIKKILIAYDGSEAAHKAYLHALDLAGKYDADLRVLAVASPPEFAEDVETEAILENAQEHYEKQFISLKEQAPPKGFSPVLRLPWVIRRNRLSITWKRTELT